MNVWPNKDLLIEVATLKDMKKSFVEKDWLVTQVIHTIKGINQEGFEVVFSGSTAFSKAHNLLLVNMTCRSYSRLLRHAKLK